MGNIRGSKALHFQKFLHNQAKIMKKKIGKYNIEI